LRELYEARLSGATPSAALAAVAAQSFGQPHRVAFLATGGAPTPARDLEFAERLCQHLGASFVDSYGTTEAGFLTANGRQLGDKYEQVQLRLVDWGSYTSQDKPFARGEVVVQTPCMALGYLGDSTLTEQSFILGGDETRLDVRPALPCGRWYRTGDLGFFDDTGMLHLLDRKSCVLHTARSEFSAGQVEASLESSPHVLHAVVHGDGMRLFCALCVAPGVTVAQVQASPEWQAFEALLAGDQVLLRVDSQPWSPQNGLLTGTLKKARRTIVDFYFSDVQGCTAQGDPCS
jgi:long-subunit acyl-CoA synthetase (AMP-forming)